MNVKQIVLVSMALTTATWFSPSSRQGMGNESLSSMHAGQFPEYERHGPYSLSQAQTKATAIRKQYPKATVQVVREKTGWFVHVVR